MHNRWSVGETGTAFPSKPLVWGREKRQTKMTCSRREVIWDLVLILHLLHINMRRGCCGLKCHLTLDGFVSRHWNGLVISSTENEFSSRGRNKRRQDTGSDFKVSSPIIIYIHVSDHLTPCPYPTIHGHTSSSCTEKVPPTHADKESHPKPFQLQGVSAVTGT